MRGYMLACGVILLTVTSAVIPTLALFFALQRSFVAGILCLVK